MSDIAGFVTLTATAEVRDKDGNLISSSPIEMSAEVTAEQAKTTRELIEGQAQ